MHILVENNKVYVYDNFNYYGTSKVIEINDSIIMPKIYKNGILRNIVLNKYNLKINKTTPYSYIKIIDYFELNFPEIYNQILEYSGNLRQFGMKILSDGYTYTIGNKFDYVFAFQLIKSWCFRYFKMFCHIYIENDLSSFHLTPIEKWSISKYYSLKIEDMFILIKEV